MSWKILSSDGLSSLVFQIWRFLGDSASIGKGGKSVPLKDQEERSQNSCQGFPSPLFHRLLFCVVPFWCHFSPSLFLCLPPATQMLVAEAGAGMKKWGREQERKGERRRRRRRSINFSSLGQTSSPTPERAHTRKEKRAVSLCCFAGEQKMEKKESFFTRWFFERVAVEKLLFSVSLLFRPLSFFSSLCTGSFPTRFLGSFPL